jgi:putative membrane protein
MLLDTCLAYAHFVAILMLVVFISSAAALCRPEWLNAAAVRRLVRVDTIHLVAAVAVLLTGGARVLLGPKGAEWYLHQPVFHAKLTVFLVMALMSIRPALAYRRWARQLDASGALPAEAEVRATRRLVMIQAHLMLLMPLAGTMLAHGVGTR